MTQSITGSSSASDPPSHPDGAIVVLARRGGETLHTAVEALTASSRAYGAKVIVLIPGPEGAAPETTDPESPVRVLMADPAATEASWRALALAETDADIVEFVVDGAAALIAWDDVTPRRLGLFRLDSAPLTNLREALDRLGVPEPAELPSRVA